MPVWNTVLRILNWEVGWQQSRGLGGAGSGGQLAVSALNAGFGKDSIMPYIYLL